MTQPIESGHLPGDDALAEWKKEEELANNAFKTFCTSPTPGNAVRLAIEDHKCGDVVDWEFVEKLITAADMVNSHAALVARVAKLEGALMEMVDMYYGRTENEFDPVKKALALLAVTK